MTLNKIDKKLLHNIINYKFKDTEKIHEDIDYFNGIPNERIVWKFWNLADTNLIKTLRRLNL